MNILKVTKLTNYRWINLFDVEYATKDGRTGHWTFASRKENPVLGNAPLIADAVVILALLKDGDEFKLVIIKEFRIPLGDNEYGFPAGLYDPNESAEDVTKRELKEETGLTVTKILYVSPPAVSSAGLSDESAVYVVCECEGTVSTEGNEGTEEISVEVLDLSGVRKILTSGEKISAKSIPFLLMFDMMNKINWPKRDENHE